MAVLPRNDALESILMLLGNKRMPMVASPELERMIGPYARDQLGETTGMPIDMTNVLDPNDTLGSYNRSASASAPPPISRDPWFDEANGGPSVKASEMMDMYSMPRGQPPEYYLNILKGMSDQRVSQMAEMLYGNRLEPKLAREILATNFSASSAASPTSPVQRDMFDQLDSPITSVEDGPAPQNSGDDLFVFMDRHAQAPPGSPSWDQQRRTLVGDMMRALGVEGNGSRIRYMSQLQEVNDAFIMKIAEKLGLNSAGEPRIARVLIANEFEHFGPRIDR